jgi:hypothetical protein
MENEVRKQVMQSLSLTPATSKDQGLIYLTIVILIMSVMTCGALFYKDSIETIAEQPKPTTKAVKTDNTQLIQLTTEVKKLSERLDALSKNQWLLGASHNHNTALNEQLSQRIDPNISTRYTSLNKDWKLNKFPDLLEYSPEERKQMMENVGSKK